jgi:hypothetical protein
MRTFTVLLICVLCSTTSALAAKKKKPKPFVGPPLECFTDLNTGTGVCRTVNMNLDVDQFGEMTRQVIFNVPQGWTLNGPAAAHTIGGRNGFDIQLVGWNATSITCQAHARGSYQIGGSGGYVVGYCSAGAKWSP